MTTITVPTVPKAQPRQRTAVRAGQAFNYTPTNAPVNAYKAALQIAWGNETSAAPLEGPVCLTVDFVLPRPASRTRKANRGKRIEHDVRPDIDNLLKSTKDALTGLAWKDDAQVSELHAHKCWSTETEQPFVQVTVASIDRWEQ